MVIFYVTLQHVKFNLSLGKHATMNIFFVITRRCLVLWNRELACCSPLPSMSTGLEGCRQIKTCRFSPLYKSMLFHWNLCFPGGSRFSFFSKTPRCWKKELFFGEPTVIMRSSNKNASSDGTFFWRLWLSDLAGHDSTTKRGIIGRSRIGILLHVDILSQKTENAKKMIDLCLFSIKPPFGEYGLFFQPPQAN